MFVTLLHPHHEPVREAVLFYVTGAKVGLREVMYCAHGHTVGKWQVKGKGAAGGPVR